MYEDQPENSNLAIPQHRLTRRIDPVSLYPQIFIIGRPARASPLDQAKMNLQSTTKVLSSPSSAYLNPRLYARYEY